MSPVVLELPWALAWGPPIPPFIYALPFAFNSCHVGPTSLQFWMLILATTIPIPAGYFLPIFIYGKTGVPEVREGSGS